ncbi:hypothetical protein EVAR_36587_1 [Eumeta japonica]|uniref:Uncharacterized protein n=1 Tax=Eumeta variegata TaxID=151549 RepID=A0A4C1XS05_EUMVA|nr:hypothetical protein EVAR_36587_1 [Eumeta japonica]
MGATCAARNTRSYRNDRRGSRPVIGPPSQGTISYATHMRITCRDIAGSGTLQYLLRSKSSSGSKTGPGQHRECDKLASIAGLRSESSTRF